MSQFCFICSKPLNESKIVVVDRGIKTLIDSSVERNDGLFEHLKDQKSITIHMECRKIYTRKSTIVAVKRQNEIEEASTSKSSPPRTRARVNESHFCLKKDCLFCGFEASEESEKKKALNDRRKISKVATLEFKESLLKVARARFDDVAKTVTARIEYEHDLVAAGAKYHTNCFHSFLRPNTGSKIGRRQDESINLAMAEIFTYIENSDDCQFSLEELKDVCKNPAIDNRTIKLRLKLKYGNKIIITEKPGRLTFILFIDNKLDILSTVWYENKKENEGEERFRILKAAAAIIREDIQSAVFDNNDNYYDINEEITDASLCEQFIDIQQEEEDEEEREEDIIVEKGFEDYQSD
ncbi:hypothetical protein JTE90_027919 [Oedothorax gibbosus]|uniref:Uncharacterized protein n=1 Tax=Oedothorax gibbosus TaxID=931172 RepID=A0AAV6U6M7_9ARAC|nr:hypothetical protein JTE90_027919 [Oedothorax gibbosus]